MRSPHAHAAILSAAAALALGAAACSVVSHNAPTPHAAAKAPAPYPATEKRPVTDELHGVKVTDDYRWLENWDDPAVKAWSEAQNAYARKVLDNLPHVDDVRARLTTLLTGSVSYDLLHAPHAAHDRLFALKHDPARQQPVLVMMKSPADAAAATVVVDPNAADAKGLTTIDWYVPSPDGSLVAVSMSSGGSESGSVHVFKATGEKLEDIVPRAQGGTAGGSLAWKADGKSFYYTRYPHPGERPEADLDFYTQVYSHTLGTPAERDTYELGKDFPKIAEIQLASSPGGSHTLASIQNGDGGIFMHWVKDEASGKWTRLSTWDDKIVHAAFGDDGYIYMVSRKDAPRGAVVRQPVKDLSALQPTPVVPQHPRNSIATNFERQSGLAAAHGKVYVTYQAGGPSELWVFAADGSRADQVSLPPIASVQDVVPTADGSLIEVQTFLTPSAWWNLPASVGGAAEPTGLAQAPPLDTSGYKVSRVAATSKDGTRVPISIIYKNGIKLDGNNPAIIWGYGGYGVNEAPAFSPRRMLWLEQGGVFAVANIRGGGEFGEEWHTAGNLLNKQNVFDDFAAAAQYLIDNRWTTRDRLALMGGSNGGLLMGAMITQHPDLAKAVMSGVGIYDMLRVELSSNGEFNVTEFGTVKDPAQFKALYAYSPYHRVREGVRYPSVLFTTGANDPRVDPMQSRKMTARLQAASPSSQTLLRTSANSGHGIGSSLSQRVEEYTDIYAWLFDQLGVEYKPVK
ncbi:MAG: prolyl oligopeptidase family serine peptidase [Phycisphaerales bacterium]|nr:prolyl oligopeptidase family serine peptidase [Phycisphaerales bacterium]